MGRHLRSGVVQTGPNWDKAGERVRAAREARGWSQNRLALEADVSRTHLGRVEAGERLLTSDLALTLASALEISASQLLPGVPGLDALSQSASGLLLLVEAAEPHVELPHWGAVGCGQGLELAHPEPELVPERAARGADGWVWARGNSMDAATPAPIPDGSQVFVRKLRKGEPADGQVVLAHTPNGAVVKRYRASGTTGYLMSETTAHPPPLPIAVGEGVEIQGVVLRVQPPLVEF